MYIALPRRIYLVVHKHFGGEHMASEEWIYALPIFEAKEREGWKS